MRKASLTGAVVMQKGRDKSHPPLPSQSELIGLQGGTRGVGTQKATVTLPCLYLRAQTQNLSVAEMELYNQHCPHALESWTGLCGAMWLYQEEKGLKAYSK